ncbi:MAG: HAMP domain-containing histidine kinase [Acidobacteriaceae bacterium]|jgi:signal transduction histidine kinase|nr:HAMP domain-containing histidine kinase [Acidobacteriaceae bacterium]
MWSFSSPARGNAALLLAAGLTLATTLTFWFGWRAIDESQRSAIAAANTRGNEVVTLLAVAFERDMKGAQSSVLLPLNEEIVTMTPYDLAEHFARGFARFPYLESFFVWRAGDNSSGSTYVFNRPERTPPWDHEEVVGDPYPVVFRQNPHPLSDVVAVVRAHATRSSRFFVSSATIDGMPYQVVAHLMYDGTGPKARLLAVAAFLVNLDWVRAHYFHDFLTQMQDIIGDTSLSLDIVAENGAVVAAVGPHVTSEPGHVRRFPLLFADPALLSQTQPRQYEPTWMARVDVAAEVSRAAATRSAARTLTLLAVGAIVTLIGLGITLRAARRAADLAAVQSEFVSAVSHEMKTPLSLIKLASDTLANGRYADASLIAEYGRLMGVEAHHLARLIDNVLCYARITDSSSEYDLEPLDIGEIVQESVDRFRPQLAALGVDVQVNLPVDAPTVNGDPLMLGQVFDNVIDNAAKYGASGRFLSVSVIAAGRTVEIAIVDHGEGIPADDLQRVFDKFYRGKGTRSRGAGLGLALVRRIVEGHQGTVRMTSTDRGTTVIVTLPTAA